LLRAPAGPRWTNVIAVPIVSLVMACAGAPPIASPSPAPTQRTPSTASATQSATAQPSESPARSSTAAPEATFEPHGSGEWIAFQSLADEFDPGADLDGIGHDDTVFLARAADGSDVHRLPGTDLVGSEIRPTWSPDGERVAFVRAQLPDDDSEVWAVNVDGSDAELLYDCGGPCNSIDYPDWSPDGASVYFTSDSNPPPTGGPPQTFEIWRYDFATGQAAVVLRREDGMSVEQMRIAPDGRRAVYVRWRNLTSPAPDAALFVANLETGSERRVTDWDLFPAYPDWSVHDRIAFNSYDLRLFPDTAKAANIYTLAPDGEDLRRLTDYGPSDIRATQPRWTPDGTGLVFTQVTPWSRDAFGDRRMAFMNADGAGMQEIAGSIPGTHPELQPGRPGSP
jgi:dipeptidyl aminopeptidase/acylaminoacyl peptidase